MLAAVAAGTIYARRSGVSPLAVADVVAPAFGLGLAIGRVGCFLTGLHPGRPTGLPWGIYFLGEVRHPIPLYESLVGLVLLGLGLLLLSRRLPRGLTALSLLMVYLVARSLLDLLRAPGVAGADPRLFGEMTLTQGIAVPIGVLAAVLGFVLLRRYRRKGGSRRDEDPGWR